MVKCTAPSPGAVTGDFRTIPLHPGLRHLPGSLGAGCRLGVTSPPCFGNRDLGRGVGAHPGHTRLPLYPSPFALRVSRSWHLSARASRVRCAATAPSPPRWCRGSQRPRLGPPGRGDLEARQGGGWAERTATSIFPGERRETRRRGPGETPPPLRPEAARTRRATRLRPPERFHKSGRWQAAN